jgi:hypothetical protein
MSWVRLTKESRLHTMRNQDVRVPADALGQVRRGDGLCIVRALIGDDLHDIPFSKHYDLVGWRASPPPEGEEAIRWMIAQLVS